MMDLIGSLREYAIVHHILVVQLVLHHCDAIRSIQLYAVFWQYSSILHHYDTSSVLVIVTQANASLLVKMFKLFQFDC
jgi:hypothetical protein